jgi:hypothetical protein
MSDSLDASIALAVVVVGNAVVVVVDGGGAAADVEVWVLFLELVLALLPSSTLSFDPIQIVHGRGHSRQGRVDQHLLSTESVPSVPAQHPPHQIRHLRRQLPA